MCEESQFRDGCDSFLPHSRRKLKIKTTKFHMEKETTGAGVWMGNWDVMGRGRREEELGLGVRLSRKLTKMQNRPVCSPDLCNHRGSHRASSCLQKVNCMS